MAGITIPDMMVALRDNSFQARAEQVTNGLLFVGYARPGMAENEPVWQIAKYDLVNGVMRRQFANSTPALVNQWTLRLTYTYG